MDAKKISNVLKAGAVLFVLIAALVVPACSDEVEGAGGNGTGGDNSNTVLGTKTFWAQNLTSQNFYRFNADLLAEGKYCKVWVEKASQTRVNTATASKIANKYDDIIYLEMIDAFDIGPINVNNGTTVFDNIMEYADNLGDNDGKLSILLLDIKDGYTPPPPDGSYTAGYFWLGNFYKDKDIAGLGYRSNEKDMIYLDTYPAKPTESLGTLAHEMQHLMNFVTSIVKRQDNQQQLHLMDTWIDEGLSSAAEYIYGGDHVKDRYEWFNQDPQKTIARGNNFFVWGNLKDTSILDDYATVYLFFQWLRIQAGGGNEIYKDIIGSAYSDYQAVTGAAQKKISWFNESASWENLLETWLAANYINAQSGRYGYNNDPTLKSIKAKMAPAGTASIQLLRGEGVYSRISDPAGYNPGTGSGLNIGYAGLKKEGTGDVVDCDSNGKYKGEALLTYNKSVNINSSEEAGKTTGLAEVQSAQASIALSRNAGTAETQEPVRIDARDMLARNGGSLGPGMFGSAGIPGQEALLKTAAESAEAGGE